MRPLLEIAAFNIESAIIAASAGADRIELCSGLSAGGLTPAIEDISLAKQQLTIPFFVMIRPKGGDFVYTEAEVEQMKADLLQAKAHGAAGFVFGILCKDGRIDERLNAEMVSMAHPHPCTFHRAFDDIGDKEQALETLIRCGFRRLLTSGGVGNAIDYCLELKNLVAQAAGRIIIMPGGGIRSSNIEAIQAQTNASEYHSAAIPRGGTLADTATIQQIKSLLR